MNADLAPVVEILDVSKDYGAGPPFRLQRLVVTRESGFVIAGLGAETAELFVHLVTGAALPDTGRIRIAGRDTREIATDTAWLASLDRFGLVSDRAVLIGSLPAAANLALPLTLAVDPLPDAVRARVEELASEVALARDRLDARTADLTPAERVRLHLARALAVDPEVLLLERPTGTLADPAARADLGATLQRVGAARQIGWVALDDDDEFARASAGTRLTLASDTGRLVAAGFWRRFRMRARFSRGRDG